MRLCGAVLAGLTLVGASLDHVLLSTLQASRPHTPAALSTNVLLSTLQPSRLHTPLDPVLLSTLQPPRRCSPLALQPSRTHTPVDPAAPSTNVLLSPLHPS